MEKIKRVSKYKHGEGVYGWHFHCPGCECAHGVLTEGDPKKNPIWEFNNNEEFPTFSPSIRVRSYKIVCHSFVKDGKIQFLNDSTHELSGRTVELPEF